MRVNVYSQELTNDTELIIKPGYDAAGKPARFQGVRLYLHSAEELHDTPEDDDRSAITLWLPKSQHRRQELAETLRRMALLVVGAPSR